MATVIAIVSLALVVAAAVVMAYSVVTRERRWGDSDWPWSGWGPGPEGGEPTGVREPRRPGPSGTSAAALADPDDRAA